MTKEVIIAIIIFILIVSANLWVSHFIDGKLNYIIAELDELEAVLNDGNYEEAQKKIDELDEYFGDSEDVLSCYIEHDELEKVKTEFTSLKTYIRLEEDDAFEALDKMAFIIRHIEEKDDIRLKNVF